jgi:hypothetical protein
MNLTSDKKLELSWTATEHKIRKSSDWFWVLWILSGTFAIVTLVFSNLITSLVILSAALALTTYARNIRTKKENSYSLTLKGVRVNGILFPYSSITKFNIIEEHEGGPVLVLDLKSLISPDIVAPLEGVSIEDVRFYLVQFVEEDHEMPIPLTHILAEKFGL